jgi:hypothetical protein
MHYWVFQFFQFASLVVAIVYHKSLKKFKLSAFIPLLVIVNITEVIAVNYQFWGWKSNYKVYSFYFIISTPFLLHTLYSMLDYKGYKKWLFITMGICLEIFVIINTFYIQGLEVITTYSYLSIEPVMVIFSFLVIAKLFFEDDSTIMMNEHPYFWINASTVIFGIGSLFIMGISGYIKAHKIQIGGNNIYRYVTQAVNYILYAAYTYAFILCRKLTTKPS